MKKPVAMFEVIKTYSLNYIFLNSYWQQKHSEMKDNTKYLHFRLQIMRVRNMYKK